MTVSRRPATPGLATNNLSAVEIVLSRAHFGDSHMCQKTSCEFLSSLDIDTTTNAFVAFKLQFSFGGCRLSACKYLYKKMKLLILIFLAIESYSSRASCFVNILNLLNLFFITEIYFYFVF